MYKFNLKHKFCMMIGANNPCLNNNNNIYIYYYLHIHIGHVQRRPPEAPVRNGVLERVDNVKRGKGRSKLT